MNEAFYLLVFLAGISLSLILALGFFAVAAWIVDQFETWRYNRTKCKERH